MSQLITGKNIKLFVDLTSVMVIMNNTIDCFYQFVERELVAITLSILLVEPGFYLRLASNILGGFSTQVPGL